MRRLSPSPTRISRKAREHVTPSTATFGTNAVDWEERVDVRPAARGAAGQAARPSSNAPTSAPLLAFDFANIRYMSATHIGTWAMDKLIRFALLTRTPTRSSWDFGSAAKHHQLYNPWLD